MLEMRQEIAWLLKEKYSGEKTKGFFTDCARLEAGEPLGYIICWVPFLDCKIWLDSKPLISRPETEYWVERAIKLIAERAATQSPRILDLCAGSGCIGVAVAKALPHTHVDFAEIDSAHHTTITKNLQENLTIIYDSKIYAGDLFAEVPEQTKYDFILSNPPYIDPALDRTEASVKDYEPHQALYGGDAGLELIGKIIAKAPDYLVPGGELWLEHEPEQSERIQVLASNTGFAITTHCDQYDLERYSRLVLQ